MVYKEHKSKFYKWMFYISVALANNAKSFEVVRKFILWEDLLCSLRTNGLWIKGWYRSF